MNSSMMKIIRASRARRSRLRFTRSTWAELTLELSVRGRGTRESGAFLLSPHHGDGRTVTGIVYLDDLDPDCLVGGIHFDGMAYRRLRQEAIEREARVVADVHTHPGDRVEQSRTDQDNPMVARAGHIALIIPNFSALPVTADQVGVHEYLGDRGWRSWFGHDARKLLYVGRWA